MSNNYILPGVNFAKQVKAAMQNYELPSQVLHYSNSGELTSSVVGALIGTAVEAGELNDFVVSVAQCGRDDAHDLGIAATLKVNGTSVLSSAVSIEGASGEASSAQVSASPVFDTTKTTIARGDRFTVDLTLTRTNPPTTEISGVFVAVKVIPVL